MRTTCNTRQTHKPTSFTSSEPVSFLLIIIMSLSQTEKLRILSFFFFEVGGGCTVDPVNYFANDNHAPMLRPNKRGREAESISHNIQRQHKLQMSLNYNHNNISVQEEAPKENLVSTGLRLSYDDDERNSSVTSASGSIVAAASPILQSLDDTLRIDLHRQKDELDQFLKIQVLILFVCVLFFALF